MADPITPALTPEQWALPTAKVYFREPKEPRDEGYGIERHSDATHGGPGLWVWDDSWALMIRKEARHAIAALCLVDQSFGFTHEDVETLRTITAPMEVHDERDIGQPSHELIDFATFAFGTKDRMYSLAARIAALLPPEAP